MIMIHVVCIKQLITHTIIKERNIEAPYLSDGRATSDAMAGLVKFPGFLLEHLAAAPSGLLDGPPPAPRGAGERWPSARPRCIY